MVIYNFKEDIFEKIDSPEKAYWVGFLYADGSISSNSHKISISLKEDDKEHLLNFENFLGMSQSCLNYREKTKSYNFTVARKKTHGDLQSLGFTSKKSYDTTITVWNNIPYQFKKDFILGLWDGDGSFSVSKDKKNCASLISNNDSLLITIVEYLNHELGEDFCKIKERTIGDPYPRIRICYNKVKTFGNWLYQNINYPVLQRKKDAFNSMEFKSKSHFGWDNKKTKGIVCLDNGNKYVTAKECCLQEFGIDNPGAINSIRVCCRGEKTTARGKHFRYMTTEEMEKEKEKYYGESSF